MSDKFISNGKTASLVGIAVNVLLFAVKLTAGILLHSTAVTADAANNLSDAGSSVITLIGIRMSEKPADAEHPFGHGRVEYIAALAVSFLIMEIGLTFLKESVGKILHPSPTVWSLAMVVLLLISVAVKIGLYFFDKAAALRTESQSLKNAAKDSLFDALITSVTIVSVLAEHYTGFRVDGFFGVAVSIVVIIAGISIIRETVSPLIGGDPDPELAARIREIVCSEKDVSGAHDLIIHNYGHRLDFATIHIEVPRTFSVEEAHLLADQIEKNVFCKTGVRLMVHVDPDIAGDENAVLLKEQLLRILKILDPALGIHDFHVNTDKEGSVVSFDLAVPYSYDEEKSGQVIQQLEALVGELQKGLRCSITVDRGYLNY